MVYRDFSDDEKDEEGELEPIEFSVGDCRDLQGREQVNGKLMMDLVAKVDSPSVGLQAEGITDVFAIVLRVDDGDNPDSFTGRLKHSERQRQAAASAGLETGVDPSSSLGRLTDYLDDPDTHIKIERLAEIVGWLVEKYTNRPTVNADDSQSGTASTNRTSKANRRLPEGSSAKKAQSGASASSTGSSSASS